MLSKVIRDLKGRRLLSNQKAAKNELEIFKNKCDFKINKSNL